jgi:quinol monooxygenase YgiN
MYCVVYVWRVTSGHEQRFEEAWRELTTLIRDEFGALGSRLHQRDDGVWFAYAQWSSYDEWARDRNRSPRMRELGLVLRQCAEDLGTLASGQVAIDLLSPSEAQQ